MGGGSSHEAHVPLPHHAHHFWDSSSWPRVHWCWSRHGFVHGSGVEELLSIESLVSLEEFLYFVFIISTIMFLYKLILLILFQIEKHIEIYLFDNSCWSHGVCAAAQKDTGRLIFFTETNAHRTIAPIGGLQWICQR